MGQLVLLRHGESEWNAEKRFTGWTDVALSPRGEDEARDVGARLHGYRFDRAYTSVLRRAMDSLKIVLEVLEQAHIPIERNQALNERMYGDLQGLNEEQADKRYGKEQVYLWRRSYRSRPPGGESLKDTADRVLPYYEGVIQPHVLAGETLLVVAHGNSLRALIMHLDRLSEDQIEALDIPTACAMKYELDHRGHVAGRHAI